MRQVDDIGLAGVEGMLVEMWEKVLKLSDVGIEDNFFELGGNSIAAAKFTNLLQERLGEPVQVTLLYEMPTIGSLAEYLVESYSDALSGISGQYVNASNRKKLVRLTDKDVGYVRETLSALNRHWADEHRDGGKVNQGSKNPQAIFVLCTARSGSTLLRVMLGGHPELFSPPELLLLPFNSLQARDEVFSGARSIWSEGVIRAIMEIKRCEVEPAKEILARCENEDLTVKAFYARLQEWLGSRRLVDKSPSYAQDVRILERAEAYFHDALYIHLLRHPVAMINSYERQRIDQLSFKENLGYDSRQMAELLWIVSHQNIIEFLGKVPRERQCRVAFEDMVKQPRKVMENVCAFLKLDFDEEMLTPHQNQERKMTDGTQSTSRMLGDPKFHSYKTIDASVADGWQKERPATLSEITWGLAEELGYERPSELS
ncbi:MAG TPA: sulfotransferase [Blastocatellia bacterium]|nr:sulfotransferase [Blastocatellia bacterium]